MIPAGVSASLTVVDGPDRGKVKKIRSRRLVIGRKTGDLILRDSKISSTHAALEFIDGRFVLFDLGSTNGTYVNDAKITEKALSSSDEVKVGFTTLLFRVSRKKKPKHPSKKLPEATEMSDLSQTEVDSDLELAIASIDEGPHEVEKSKKIMLTFRIKAGPLNGERFRLDKDSIVIGRVNTDIRLKEDQDVSRKHAVVEVVAGGQIFVRDLASTNGTFINGKRISNSRLRNGDEIKVGNTKLVFSIEVEPR